MKLKYLIPSTVIAVLLSTTKALAFCPVCTFAVAGGVGLSRYLGVDDTITGLWIGAFLVSSSVWTINYLAKKKVNFIGIKILIPVAFYTLLIGPFYRYGIIIHHHLNKIWGIDKLIFGIAVGSIFFLAGMLLYEWLKKRNKGRAHFHFEKIVIVLAPIIILSGLFYFLTRG